MPLEVTVVTSNPGKIREIRELLRPRGWSVRWSRRTLPEPQADTLEEVVGAKLDALGPTHGWTLVEDSGFFVDSLQGFPGVYSAYALRTVGLPPLLQWVRGRPRGAVFRTVAGARFGDRTWVARGEVRGTLAASIRGSGGFGFDPIFLPPGSRRTYGEMSAAEKARTSHRSRAVGALMQKVEPVAHGAASTGPRAPPGRLARTR
jgi:XTP/dITP diphosphohydrolase